MEKVELETLYNRVEAAVGEKYCWFNDWNDGTVEIQVPEWEKDYVREIIDEAGYEITHEGDCECEDFYCVAFTIKK